jgi:hypothetical protein
MFRDALMHYWGDRCPLTGITDPALLRASHIVPWADCADEQRLDVYNGLLLSALWDAAFDQSFVSFADDGAVLASPRLGEVARKTLGADAALPLAASIGYIARAIFSERGHFNAARAAVGKIDYRQSSTNKRHPLRAAH